MPSSDRFELVPNTVPGEKPWLLRRHLASGTMSWHVNETTIRAIHEVLDRHLTGKPAAKATTTPPRDPGGRRCVD